MALLPEVLERIQNASSVAIVSDNALAPLVAVSAEAPVVGVSLCPRPPTRRKRGSNTMPTNCRWSNDDPVRHRPVMKLEHASPDHRDSTFKPERRRSLAMPENESIQDHVSSPSQEKMTFTLSADCCFHSPLGKDKFSPECDKESNSSGSSSNGLLFNRWDSSPVKHSKSLHSADSIVSLRTYAARASRSLKKSNAAGGMVSSSDRLLSPPKKPIRRGSFEEGSSDSGSSTMSDTANLLDEALRITAQAQYENDPFEDEVASLPAPPFVVKLS